MKNANSEVNNITKNCSKTSKRQKIGKNSKNRDKNVKKIVTRGVDKVGFIRERIRFS